MAAGAAPTVFMGSRLITTTYLYDDPDHPGRVTGSIESPAYTHEDRALLVALREWENSLCRCGEPRAEAWHSGMDGEYEATPVVCHACSAINHDPDKPDAPKTTYHVVANTRSARKPPLTPLVIGETTVSE